MEINTPLMNIKSEKTNLYVPKSESPVRRFISIVLLHLRNLASSLLMFLWRGCLLYILCQSVIGHLFGLRSIRSHVSSFYYCYLYGIWWALWDICYVCCRWGQSRKMTVSSFWWDTKPKHICLLNCMTPYNGLNPSTKQWGYTPQNL